MASVRARFRGGPGLDVESLGTKEGSMAEDWGDDMSDDGDGSDKVEGSTKDGEGAD